MTSVAADAVQVDESDRARLDLRAWHASSWGGPVVTFVAMFGLWVTALAVGVWSEQVAVRAAMVVLLTLASAQLFTLGHDAGHGSFSTSPTVNAVVGRLALVPSVHVFALWRAHHDIHHRYTNLRGRDFVWTPATVAEYRGLGGWRRTLHRVYRHRSGLGLGLQYAIEIWAPRMLWPRSHHELGQPGRLKADAILLCAILGAVAVSAWGLVATVDPGRAGNAGSWASAAVVLFVVPLLGTHWLIGFVIYLNHTHPRIVWFDDPTDWSRSQVQLEGSARPRFAPWRQLLAPRRIMNHPAHHVDPGVPLRTLAGAQQHLDDRFGDRIVSYDWSPQVFRDVLSQCKLYDYEAKRWLTYEAVEGRT